MTASVPRLPRFPSHIQAIVSTFWATQTRAHWPKCQLCRPNPGTCSKFLTQRAKSRARMIHEHGESPLDSTPSLCIKTAINFFSGIAYSFVSKFRTSRCCGSGPTAIGGVAASIVDRRANTESSVFEVKCRLCRLLGRHFLTPSGH